MATQTLNAKRTLVFFIKGQQTMLEIDCNDPRPDSQIIRDYRSKRKVSLEMIRDNNKAIKLSKDYSDRVIPGKKLYGMTKEAAQRILATL